MGESAEREDGAGEIEVDEETGGVDDGGDGWAGDDGWVEADGAGSDGEDGTDERGGGDLGEEGEGDGGGESEEERAVDGHEVWSEPEDLDGHAECEDGAEGEADAEFLPCDAEEGGWGDFAEGHGADDHGGGLATGVAACGDDHGHVDGECEDSAELILIGIDDAAGDETEEAEGDDPAEAPADVAEDWGVEVDLFCGVAGDP